MAEKVTINPLHGARTHRKISVGGLPAPQPSDRDPPPLRRTRSMGGDSLVATASPGRDSTTPSPYDADIIAQLKDISERTTALLEHSPRAAELTRLLSRADAQTKNSTIAVNKVFLMEGRLQTALERLEKNLAMLEPAPIAPSEAPDVGARYDRRNSVRTLRAIGCVETMIMSQNVALNRIEDKLDLVMTAVTRLATIQRGMEEIRGEVVRIADALEAIEKSADGPVAPE